MIDLPQRVATQPWAAEIVARLRAKLAPRLAIGPVIPPPEPLSGWGHRYLCAQCQSTLDFDPASPTSHRCPACGWIGSGRAELDEAWVYHLNLRQIEWAEEAAIVAAATGDATHRDFARGVLLGYTRAYDGYVEHGDRAGTGRLQPQSLCEAVWMLRAERVCGALLAINALSSAELTEVRTNLFAPAIALLRRQTSDVHNIHVWTAAAVWALAWRCEQLADVAFAERILALNLERGVLAHGSWYELSPLYHYYTCEAFLAYARAAHAAGRPSLVDATLPAMLRSPLALALNHGQIALVNDGWQTNALADKAWFYELAEGLWGGFGDVLGHLYGPVGAQREGVIALQYGPEVVAPAQLVHPPVTVVDGIAVVRRRGLTAWIKATAHAGGHDHPDKPALNLQLDDSDLRAGDIGNPGYGSHYHGEWFKRTWSHNALLVDGRDATCGPARIDRTVHTPWVSVVTAGSDEAYPGVRIRRVVLVGDGWVIDWIRAESSQTHRWQNLFHVNGSLDAPGTPHAVFSHRFVTDERLLARGEWQGRWRSRTTEDRLLVAAHPPADGLVTAFSGPDLPTDRQRDCLVVEGSGERFAAHLVLWRGASDDTPCPVKVSERAADFLVIQIDDRQLRIGAGGDVRSA
jgi:hypothetical protein